MSQTTQSQTQAQDQRQGAQQPPAQQSRQSGGKQTGRSRRAPFVPSLFALGPFELMRELASEMDQMIAAYSGAPAAGSSERGPGAAHTLWVPQVEVFERDNELVVRADLPGIPKEDLRVEITDGMLTIEGERRSEHTEERGNVYRSERVYGTFRRQIPLPEDVNVDEAKVKFRNGVLEVTIPAQGMQSRRRQLEISEDQASGGDGKQQPPQPGEQGQNQ
jgi:HSP20 family protein